MRSLNFSSPCVQSSQSYVCLQTIHRNAPRSDVHQTKLSASHAPLQPFVWFDATYATYALQLVRKLHELESGTSSNFASISAA